MKKPVEHKSHVRYHVPYTFRHFYVEHLRRSNWSYHYLAHLMFYYLLTARHIAPSSTSVATMRSPANYVA